MHYLWAGIHVSRCAGVSVDVIVLLICYDDYAIDSVYIAYNYAYSRVRVICMLFGVIASSLVID